LLTFGSEIDAGVLAFRRAGESDERIVLVNFSEREIRIDVTGIVEVSSVGRGEGSAFAGVLEAESAVLLRRIGEQP
jgi:hypothetical protein